MSHALTVPGQPGQKPLPRREYTAALLTRCMEDKSIPQARLEEIRLALHRAVSERAEAYTKGRSMTVTRAQAEAFYVSVFYQLDAALLAMHSDDDAAEALRTAPVADLLDAGMMRILQLYEEAKEHFRRAYQLTKPFATAFFRDLLTDFSHFCTEYDARFHPDAVKIDEVYPLLGGRKIDLPGVLGVHAYYTALMYEGELLQCFPADEIPVLMRLYAKRYLTTPDMIAESIADLVLRQWICRALLGDCSAGLKLPQEADVLLTERCQHTPADVLCERMRKAVSESFLAEKPEVCAVCEAAMPTFAGTLQRRVAENNLRGWITAEYTDA